MIELVKSQNNTIKAAAYKNLDVRPLQPTGQPNEFWAAIPRYGSGTLVGKYRSDRFLFTPLLKLPGLIFSSMDMWVAEDKIYFVYNGDILSVPISAQSK